MNSDTFIIGAGYSVHMDFLRVHADLLQKRFILRSGRCGVSLLERVASDEVRARGKPVPPK